MRPPSILRSSLCASRRFLSLVLVMTGTLASPALAAPGPGDSAQDESSKPSSFGDVHSLRLQYSWDRSGLTDVTTRYSAESPSEHLGQHGHSRIAEWPNSEGAWEGWPVSKESGSAVVFLSTNQADRPLQLHVPPTGPNRSTITPSSPLDSSERDEAPELVTIAEVGPPSEHQDIVFLSEGYQLHQREEFLADVEASVDHLSSIEPYERYIDFLNIWALFLPSEDSGADHLEANPPTEVDTALGCHYGAYGIARLIDCEDSLVLNAAAHAPGEDVRIVLVGDDTYGGSGGAEFAVASTGPDMPEIVAHEMAHSDGGLADEYSYGIDSQGWDYEFPNCSADPSSTPWEHWVGVGSLGVDRFPECSYTDYYRPTNDACRMMQLGVPFCVVCRESLVRTIYGHDLKLITSAPQSDTGLSLEPGENLSLEVEHLAVSGDPLWFSWSRVVPLSEDSSEDEALELDLLDEGPGLSTLDLSWEDLPMGSQELVVRVEDRTEWVITGHPPSMTDEVRFLVDVEEASPSGDDDDSGGASGSGCSCTHDEPRPRAGSEGLALLGLALLFIRRGCRARADRP